MYVATGDGLVRMVATCTAISCNNDCDAPQANTSARSDVPVAPPNQNFP
jgi:hypothetical protein